jgi:hypothetical protein
MTTQTRSTVAALAFALLTTACSSAPTALVPDRLEGRWSWTSASGGFAGHTITPASEGYTMEVRFRGDGSAELYRDGALTKATDFEIGIGREGGSFPGREVIRFEEPLFGGWEEMSLELPGPDRLVLGDGCCDGYTYDFERIE